MSGEIRRARIQEYLSRHEMLTVEEVKQRFDDLISALMAQMGGGAGEEAPAQ